MKEDKKKNKKGNYFTIEERKKAIKYNACSGPPHI
jgi:hypothetical protein